MGFTFSEGQRRTLADCMKRLPTDLVQSFLNRCEYAINEWQADWPVERMGRDKGASVQLRALSDAIFKVRIKIESLPDGASCALWSNWQYAHGKDITNLRVPEGTFLAQLLELEQTASVLADDLSNAGGVVKCCEKELVDRLVQAYFDSSFQRPPSDATNGIFMRVLGEIENTLTLPGGGKLAMGRDIVRASIEWHKRREDEFAQQHAGMYEFPTKTDS